jgi:DNA-binding transcriptional ArsR family regulator
VSTSNAEVDRLFEALADERRRTILSEIVRRQATTATEIATGLPISRQAVSQHLVALSGAGLVERKRAGRFVVYRATPAGLFSALAWISELGAAVAKHQDAHA